MPFPWCASSLSFQEIVFRTSYIDYGPLTKLFGALEWLLECESIECECIECVRLYEAFAGSNKLRRVKGESLSQKDGLRRE